MSLDVIMQRLAALEARVASLESGGARSSSSSDVGEIRREQPLSDSQLSNAWADKKIGKDPKKWKGPSQVGKFYSRAPLEWLELAAEACEFKAYKGRQEDPPRLKNNGKPWHESDSFEARILRAWAERRRKQPPPAPATPSATDKDADEFPFGANAPVSADDEIGF